jgi:hypothetical protein
MWSSEGVGDDRMEWLLAGLGFNNVM